ncbi:MAG: lactate utilization protein [bacterium]|nr:lactate utilization protein [Acidimicrobiia bacterium]MCY4650897.1 lactate utilization protein [bacterium]
MERSAFLSRISQAVSADTVPGHGAEHPEPTLPRLPEVDLTSHFIEAFEELDGRVHHEPPVEVIAKIMADRGTDEYVAWDSEHLPTDGLLDELTERGYRRVETVLPSDPDGRIAHQMGYFDVGVGISAAVAVLAESGSVVVTSGPGRSRLASVIPEVHVVLVPTNRMFRSLSHWAAQVESPHRLANIMVVSGPSRTGDIELTLTRGVHGPGEVHAVLL